MSSVSNTLSFQVTTGTTATNLPSNKLQLGATLLAGTAAVTIGTTSAVSTSNGFTIAAGQNVRWQGSNTNQLFVISATASSLSVLGN